MKIKIILAVCILIFSNCIFTFASINEDLKLFFSTRKVLYVVNFQSDLAVLSEANKKQLNDFCLPLSKVDRQKYIVRVEGVVTKSLHADSQKKSFELARSVADYLNMKSASNIDLYLTGLIDGSDNYNRYKNRVEIVIYENLFDIDSAVTNELSTDLDKYRYPNE